MGVAQVADDVRRNTAGDRSRDAKNL
jgi:hypothetical protein